MRIEYVWPGCTRHDDGDWDHEPEDAFWIFCDIGDEVESCIMPLLPAKKKFGPEHALRFLKDCGGIQPTNTPEGKYPPGLCFLVTRSLGSIELKPWYYPNAGMWNGSPFRRVEPKIEIHNLCELQDIRVVESMVPKPILCVFKL